MKSLVLGRNSWFIFGESITMIWGTKYCGPMTTCTLAIPVTIPSAHLNGDRKPTQPLPFSGCRWLVNLCLLSTGTKQMMNGYGKWTVLVTRPRLVTYQSSPSSSVLAHIHWYAPPSGGSVASPATSPYLWLIRPLIRTSKPWMLCLNKRDLLI